MNQTVISEEFLIPFLLKNARKLTDPFPRLSAPCSNRDLILPVSPSLESVLGLAGSFIFFLPPGWSSGMWSGCSLLSVQFPY